MDDREIREPGNQGEGDQGSGNQESGGGGFGGQGPFYSGYLKKQHEKEQAFPCLDMIIVQMF
jgi:hypothetical protein